MSGRLYIVGTPIGNLGDFSDRGREVLSAVDFIAAEDTRVTLKLLARFEIRRPLVSYHEHNRYASGDRIVARIRGGEDCALVTDAGMPAISDPGAELVALAAAAGVEVVAVPGPSALTAALALSGLDTGRFCFEGFLSTSKAARNEHLESLKAERRAMVFYEAPHKLRRTLDDLLAALGDRPVSVSRELTKRHEETLRTTLSGAAAHFAETEPRGEFVLVVAGAEKRSEPAMSVAEALDLLWKHREAGCSLKEAAKRAAGESGFSKNELYNAAVAAGT